jgi:signal transduction histidine kinase/BarA-like signal transduction histidine kinase
MELSSLHSLLARQVNRYLTPECLQHERFQQFVRAVHDSYQNFDRDKKLFEHASLLNDREYAAVTQRLKEEVGQRRQSAEKLVEAIRLMQVPGEVPAPAFDPDNLIGLVEFLQEQIEHRQRIETELRQAKEQAEEATQAKSEFLSMMSHEIRTPLNGIVGITYLMLQEGVPPALEDHLRTLQFSIEHLHSLINDILDFSKIEAGKVDLEEIDFDFKQLVSHIKKAQQVKADERGNRIRLMVDDDIPDSLVGDPTRLGQVLTNLVSNAIKFTQNGTITVELTLLQRAEEWASIYVSVQDTGIGIPPEKQQSIFELFTQANSSTTRTHGGTGLGLVITRRLLELYDSAIEVRSEVGKGSTFSFQLTLRVGSAVKPAYAPLDSFDAETLRGLRLLLVEDYPVNVKVALKFLDKWGVEVTTAENGLIGVEKCQNASYDLILMDLQMPVMDGYTASERIRSFNPTIPIIALTASATFSNKDRAAGVGITDYVTKPFNPKELFYKIARYCQRAQ